MKPKVVLAMVALSLAASGCSNITPQEECTAGGAVLGGLAGSVLTNQSTVGTVGGAAAVGVAGNELAKRGRCP